MRFIKENLSHLHNYCMTVCRSPFPETSIVASFAFRWWASMILYILLVSSRVFHYFYGVTLLSQADNTLCSPILTWKRIRTPALIEYQPFVTSVESSYSYRPKGKRSPGLNLRPRSLSRSTSWLEKEQGCRHQSVHKDWNINNLYSWPQIGCSRSWEQRSKEEKRRTSGSRDDLLCS